jgi:hypothetical protein
MAGPAITDTVTVAEPMRADTFEAVKPGNSTLGTNFTAADSAVVRRSTAEVMEATARATA